MFLINVPFESLIGGMGAERAAWATVGPGASEVTTGDLRRLHRELQLLQSLGAQLSTPDRFDRPEYWYLLAREAEEAGLVPAASLGVLNVTPETVAAISAATGEPESFVLETLSRLEGVRRLLQSAMGGGRWSDRRLKHEAQRNFFRASIQPVVIEAEAPEEPPAFSDEEIRAQFDKYASAAPGEGETGFGYRLPDRARLEWLAVTADDVRAMIEESGKLDAVALRKHWRQHAGRFGEPQADADVPDAVRADYLAQLVARTLDDIAKDAGDQLRLDRRGLTQRGGYFEIPEGWSGRRFEDLALDLRKSYGIALPRYESGGDRWLTAEEVRELQGVGDATTDKFGDRPMGLVELVMAARELHGSPAVPIQVGIAGPVLRGADGSIYLFRIAAADRARAPSGPEEVRDRVVADLALLAAYRDLVGRAEAIRGEAVSEGMLATALAHGTTVGRSASMALNTAATASIPGLGPSRDAVEAIIDHAIMLPPDKPLAEIAEDDLVVAVPVDDRHALLLARIVDRTPVTTETYRSFADRGLVQAHLMNEELGDDTGLRDAFSYEALARRHDFKLAGADEAAAEAVPPVPAQAGN
jgi:hypothetical protein